MAQAICNACSFKIDLPPQVQLSKVNCPRCRGALSPTAAVTAAAPMRKPLPTEPGRESPRPASRAPARDDRPEPRRVKRPTSRPRSDDRSNPERDDEDESTGMSMGLKIGLITVPILAVLAAILFIALNRGGSTPEKPNAVGPGELAKGGGVPGPNPGGFGPNPGGFGPNPGGFGAPAPGKNQQVQFLGAVGQGQRFVIIADRSGSMNAPVRLSKPDDKGRVIAPSIECLHDELIRTVKEIPAGASFYISFFDSRITPMPRGDTWVAGGGDLTDIIDWIRTIRPQGGTVPLPAFQKAFSLDPPPDVIFFMTDGVFPDSTAQIAMMNDRLPRKAVIHSIRFDNSSGLGRAGPGGRQSRMLELFELPAPVHAQIAMHVKGPGIAIPRRIPSKQMEMIAAASGGTFRDFGGDDAKKEVEPKKVAPVLALASELTPADPPCRHRARSHAKTFDVVLQAGMHYEIDMVGTIDPFLYLEDAAGTVIASNGAGGLNRNALIVIRPAVSGPYRIIASTRTPGRFGPFALTLIDRPL